MQFITNGPDIPDKLLEAHEEGRVVFFCGAGISRPAGLPDFKGLVDNIYKRVNTKRTPIEDDAYSREHFDATLDLLEQRLPGERIAVRNALKEALQPNLRRKGASDTHAALLQLARNREGILRLVTTNFDHIFKKVAKRTKQLINAYAAPMLPIPKNSRWDGLVYLHGILPDKMDDGALQHLVVTSGDFGLAYLTERWGARFVSELFRNYVVCFVGYGINDPVLRYMMDALAADRRLGEVTPQAYALGDCAPSQEKRKTIEWEAKGVTPILYEISSDSDDHSMLHKTLKSWAETYRDGILGRERIVIDYALARPSASTQQDDFVGRMLWALSHKSGLPAKRFAEFNPAPSLEWLETFSENRYQHEDLSSFGVPPCDIVDDKLKFSMIHRPAPYKHAPWMKLFPDVVIKNQWDDVMFHLAYWLTRHLNNQELILWFVKRGGQVHERLSWIIESELNRFAQLKHERKTAELEDIRNNAPDAIPCPSMQILWRLLLAGRMKSSEGHTDIYYWEKRLRRDGLSTMLRLELREFLTPRVILRKSFQWDKGDDNKDTPKNIRQLVDWELSLATSHVQSVFRDLKDKQWHKALPKLLDELQQLLRDALDLCRELGEADKHNDRSIWDMPSISPHRQNHHFRDWVVLIELLRDSWLAIRKINTARATKIAQEWFEVPYPTFKRLALFAASHDECIKANQWVGWLINDDAWWLWSLYTRRETMRLLILQGARLPQKIMTKLETVILKGPPRAMYKDDIEPTRWQSRVDRSVWLCLAKLRKSGRELGDSAAQRYNELSVKNPKWKLANNESDEFPCWVSGTGDPDYKERINIAPRKRHELVKWLKKPLSKLSSFDRDTWRETCKKHPANAGWALSDLASEGIWLDERWMEAFYAWNEKKHSRLIWQWFAPLVQSMPDTIFQKTEQAISWWLEAVAKSMDRHEDIFFKLCDRVLELPRQDNLDTDLPVMQALNHPIGHITQALLNLWLKHGPNDNDSLPTNIKSFFCRICNTKAAHFRHGRVLLASRLISLFRVDRPWTEKYLLPLFDWDNNATEARAAWEGFLWSPRLYRPLLLALKPQFLATAHHYTELGEQGCQFAKFFTYTALSPGDDYTAQDFQTAFDVLPSKALNEAAQTLVQALESAGEQRENYWRNCINPFWQNVWPQSIELISDSIVKSLANMSIAARGEFPVALSTVSHWLRPIEDINYVMHVLHEAKLAVRFPEDTLKLLGAIVDNPTWVPKELKQCLETIGLTAPQLLKDLNYKRLSELIRMRGVP